MKRPTIIIAILFFSIFSSINVQGADVPPPPTEEGIWVIDDADLLTQEQADYLNDKCNNIYLETGTPIVILSIESYESQNAPEWWGMEEYARFAFDEYGINDDRNQNKAVLIFISESDRQFRIELGGGWKNMLDDYVQSVFDNEVIHWLGEDLWYEGLNAAVEGMRPVLEEGEIVVPDFDWSDGIWVVDEGNIISNDDQLNLMINELETSCPILIVTINNLAEKNASWMRFGSYIDKVFDEFEMPDCGIIWGMMRESTDWGESWYQITVSSGEQYDGDWDRYLQDQTWKIEDRLYWGSGMTQATNDMIKYSEKAINDDGFEFDEWVKINLFPFLSLPTILFLVIGLFVYSLPKKSKFRRRKGEALENTAIINKAIMGNLSGNSNIIKEWNGVFDNMKDSEIKAFRKLDEKLETEDVNISLEKYEKELKVVKEVYNLRTTKADYTLLFSIMISLTLTFMLLSSYFSSDWAMEAKSINGEDIGLALFGTVFIGAFVFPILAFIGGISGLLFGGGELKNEMALILGLPIMRRRLRTNYRDDNYDNYMWNYQGMNRSFRRSSGSTRAERRSSSSSSGGGGFQIALLARPAAAGAAAAPGAVGAAEVEAAAAAVLRRCSTSPKTRDAEARLRTSKSPATFKRTV